MIISTDLALGLICPFCDEPHCFEFSLFELKNQEYWRPRCSCGESVSLLAMGYDNIMYVCLDFPCCKELHEYSFHPEEFADGAVLALTCDADGAIIAYIGQSESVYMAISLEP